MLLTFEISGLKVDLERGARDTHGYVGAVLLPFVRRLLFSALERTDVIDLEDETIDAEVLNSMAVSNEHFVMALGASNPSSLRETVSLAELLCVILTCQIF